MTWLDVVLAVFIAASAFLGWFKGMVRAAFGLAVALLAIWAAAQVYQGLGHSIHYWIRLPETTANWLAFFLIYAAVHTVASLLAALLGLGARFLPQPMVSRLAGFVLAGYRAIVQAAVLVLALTALTHWAALRAPGPVIRDVLDASEPLLMRITPNLVESSGGFVLSDETRPAPAPEPGD